MTRACTLLTVGQMNQRIVAMALVTTLPVALLGCASSGDKQLSRAQYKQRLAALDRQDSKAHAKVDGLPHSHSVAAMKASLSAFAADEGQIGNQVAALTPPANAVAANAALAKAFHDSASDTKRVEAAIASAGTPRQALAIIRKLGSAMKGGPELDTALTRLKKLGHASGD